MPPAGSAFNYLCAKRKHGEDGRAKRVGNRSMLLPAHNMLIPRRLRVVGQGVVNHQRVRC